VSAKKPATGEESTLRTPLLPHQQRVVDRISQPDQPGLVVAHGLGSGKTLTSIAAQEALGMPSTVVVPAALRANYEKERAKHLVEGAGQSADIHSLQNVARKGAVPSAPLLIVDEAHRARESGTKTQGALARNTAEKRLLLTGSPFYNHPADLSPLINIAAGERVLPNARAQFAERYIATRKISPGLLDRLRGVTPGEVEGVNPRTSSELSSIYGKYVDHHPGSTEGFPTVERRDVEVPMSREQLRVYDTVMGAAPPWFARKVRAGLPPSKAESKALNAFSGAVRQVSNTTRAHQPNADEYAPKIDAAAANLQRHLGENPNARAVVYSNYLDAGLRPYSERLSRAGVAHGLFTGDQTATERNEMVRRYNAGELKALLLSSAGGEGLDLKGTRLMQVLEPHWNDEKIKQVEGRGVRYQSHADLPEAERKVLIERYLSTRPRSGLLERLHLRAPGGGIDRYLADRSKEKEDLLEQFRALLPKAPPPPKKDTKMSKKTAGLADREYMRGAPAEAAGRHVGGTVRRIADAAERGIGAAGGPLSAGIGALQGERAADTGDGFGGAIAGVAGTAAARGLVDHIPATSPGLRVLGEIASPLIGGHVGGRLYSRVKRIAVGPRGESAPPPVDYGSYEDARQKWAAAAAEQVAEGGDPRQDLVQGLAAAAGGVGARRTAIAASRRLHQQHLNEYNEDLRAFKADPTAVTPREATLRKLREHATVPVYLNINGDNFYTRKMEALPPDVKLIEKTIKPGPGVAMDFASTPATLAHELGHALVDQHPATRWTQSPTAKMLSLARGPYAAAALGAATGLTDDKATRAAGLALPAAAHLPKLLSEGLASAHGLKLVHAAGGSRRKALASLLPAFGTYATAAAEDTAASAASQAGISGVRRLYERHKKDKATKEAGLLQRVGQTLTREGGRAGHIAEVAGLGMLAANPIDELQAKARSKPGEEWEHKSLLGGEKGHAVNDIAGLGVLAAPSVAHLLQHHAPKVAASVRPGGDVVTVRSHVRRRKTTEKRASVSMIPLEVGFFHELEKVGTITPEEARESLERLDAANKSTGSPEQVRRYAALGAAAGLATDVGSSFVSGAPYFKAPPGTPFARTRAIGASALRGAVASGAIPLVRAGLDRAAETATLRRYVAENPTPATPTEG